MTVEALAVGFALGCIAMGGIWIYGQYRRKFGAVVDYKKGKTNRIIIPDSHQVQKYHTEFGGPDSNAPF